MFFEIKEYKTYCEEEVLPLYQSVGWSNYWNDPAMLRKAYLHSLKIYAAYAEETLAGIVRVVGDGHSIVFVQDLLVRPEYQRKGIGTALLQKILEDYKEVYQLHLLTDNTEKTAAFYKSMGFLDNADIGCKAFSKYHVK